MNNKLFRNIDRTGWKDGLSEDKVSKLVEIGARPHTHAFYYDHDYVDSFGKVSVQSV